MSATRAVFNGEPLSDEEKYAERDLVLAKRQAWADGFLYRDENGSPRSHDATLSVIARRLYPLPKITRRRVVKDPCGAGWWTTRGTGDERGSIVMWRLLSTDGWKDLVQIDKYRAPVVFDLVNNPLEEVDDDA